MKLRALHNTTGEPPPPSRMTQLLAGLDSATSLLSRSTYRGDNAAVARAYGPMRAGMWVVTAILLLTFVFGVLVPLESAAVASGNVVVMSNRKTVQHLEGGIVKAILVKEGDMVKKDQPLVEISDIAPKASREIVQSDLWMARAAEIRLRALQQNVKQLQYPKEMLAAAEANPELKRTMEAQAELFATQRDTQRGKLDTLQQRITQSEEEITGLAAQLKSTQSQLALITQEIGSVSKLLKQGLATKSRLLALQREAEELRGNKGQYTATIAKTEQAIIEAQMEVLNLENEFSTKLAEEQGEVHARMKDQEEKLRAASDVVARTTVTAPSEGVVTGLKVHTVGGVIAPGEPIMDIVPQSDRLVLEVRVKPIDIDVVAPGLTSRVVFSAYKSRRMPLLEGVVTQVSADAFHEQAGNQPQSYYTARVEVDGKQLSKLDTAVNLTPGMPAEVFIRTGTRTFLGYLFSPLSDSLRRAFKEE